MTADHQYLDDLWAEFMAEDTNSANAILLFNGFRDHLSSHIKLENEALFPRFDAYLKIDTDIGPTVIARRDHENILKLLTAVAEACLTNQIAKIKYASSHLHDALLKHHEREAEIQYPLGDTFIPADEWGQILLKFYGEDGLREIIPIE